MKITDLDRKAWAYSDKATNEGHEGFALACHRPRGRQRTQKEEETHQTTLKVAFWKQGIDPNSIMLLGEEEAEHYGKPAIREIWVGRKKKT
jgi:hypothetical protein